MWYFLEGGEEVEDSGVQKRKVKNFAYTTGASAMRAMDVGSSFCLAKMLSEEKWDSSVTPQKNRRHTWRKNWKRHRVGPVRETFVLVPGVGRLAKEGVIYSRSRLTHYNEREKEIYKCGGQAFTIYLIFRLQMRITIFPFFFEGICHPFCNRIKEQCFMKKVESSPIHK